MQTRRRIVGRALRPFVLGFVLVLSTPGCAQHRTAEVPYVPTPYDVVRNMLDMAKVGPGDVVLDLGSGDGRIVIAAVRDFGASRAVGVDINPVGVREGIRNANNAGVSDRTAFVQGNVFDVDFEGTSVVTMYLLPEVNLRLRPRLLAGLKPGARIVSHAFNMGEWRPDRISRSAGRNVYLWIVPAHVHGIWRLDGGPENYRLDLRQSYQRLSGDLRRGDTEVSLEEARLEGDRLGFAARLGDGTLRFDLRMAAPDRLEGTLRSGGENRTVVLRRAS